MKKAARLFAIVIVLLAASAVPSLAILPICSEYCTCESNCDWGCWDRDSVPEMGTNCGDWGACGDVCGVAP
jgi:hypothetical protein